MLSQRGLTWSETLLSLSIMFHEQNAEKTISMLPGRSERQWTVKVLGLRSQPPLPSHLITQGGYNAWRCKKSQKHDTRKLHRSDQDMLSGQQTEHSKAESSHILLFIFSLGHNNLPSWFFLQCRFWLDFCREYLTLVLLWMYQWINTTIIE